MRTAATVRAKATNDGVFKIKQKIVKFVTIFLKKGNFFLVDVFINM